MIDRHRLPSRWELKRLWLWRDRIAFRPTLEAMLMRFLGKRHPMVPVFWTRMSAWKGTSSFSVFNEAWVRSLEDPDS